MSEIWNSRRGVLFAAGIIALAAVAAYSNTFRVPFLFDDIPSTIENPTIRRLWPIGPILLPPGRYAAVQRRPMINASLAINYAISGEKTWSYHAFNLAAHILAALVLFGVVRRTLLLPRSRDRFGGVATPLAAAVALLWAVHPLLTDAVTYIIQRTEVFCGLFYLLTLYCTIRGDSAQRPARWYVAAVAACVLAVGSKETALSAPLVVMLYDRVFLSASWREVFQRRGPLYLGLALSWLVILAMLPYGGEGSKLFGEDGAFILYPLAQPGVIAHYLKLCLWPTTLVFDYGFYRPETAWQIIPYLVLIGALCVAVIDAFRYRPWLGFLGVWFFAILAPSSSFIPLLQQTGADKRMYLPLAAVVTGVVLGGFLAAQWLVRHGLASPRAMRVGGSALVLLVAVVLGLLTVRRNVDYRSTLSIWQDTVAKLPNSPRAHGNLGLALASTGHLDEALAEYRKALDLVPNYAAAYNDIGNVLMRRGRVNEAIPNYEQALKLMPEYESAHNNMGNILLSMGRINEAIAHFQKALKSKPEHETTYNNIGTALATCGQMDDAIKFFQKAVYLRPNFADAHNNLGRALASQGRIDEAIVHFRAGVELRPHDATIRKNLDRALAQQATKLSGPVQRQN